MSHVGRHCIVNRPTMIVYVGIPSRDRRADGRQHTGKHSVDVSELLY